MALDTNVKLSDVITSLSESQGINQKAELASVIGSPATISDNIATQITKLQTAKNTLAEKIGVENTTPLQEMADNLVIGKKWASGSVKSSSSTSNWLLLNGRNSETFGYGYRVEVTGLSFEPSAIMLYAYAESYYGEYFTIYNKNATGTYASKLMLGINTRGSSNSGYAYNIVSTTPSYSVTNGSFLLPIIAEGLTVNWYAFE